MTCYFIKAGDSELGPFTLKQLKSRSITKDTPVWFTALREWTNAGEVHELKELFVTKLPPRSFPKSQIHKMWDHHKLLKQQFKKVSYQFILIRARKNLY